METQGQTGTPKAFRKGKGIAHRFAWRRNSVLSSISAFAFFAIFAAPQVARAQQSWPGSGNPNPGFPQDGMGQDPSSAAVNPDVVRAGPNDPLGAMTTAAALLPMIAPDNSRLIEAESCQTWTAAAVNSPTVSVARLQVPGKASHEFQKACGNFKDKRLKAAEDHARKAVKIYPDYAAAWVLLGQILQADHHDNEAIDACRKAEDADPDYAPPYICLAGFAAQANDWDEAYSLSSRALSLDPATDAYAYLYTATADFHLKRLDQAELYARSAEKLDKWKRVPEVHLLLASLYDVKGDQPDEATELRKFVKESPHNASWAQAKTKLAELQDHVAAK
jgi:tetratricopeptide (TPR) repeat protein